MLEVNRFKRIAMRDLHTHTNMTIDDGVDRIAANLLLCVLEVYSSMPHSQHRALLTNFRCSKHTKTTPAG
jgi:hypothetical protein